MTQREHLVRERAYYIWEGEGRIFGRAETHWLQAESELRASQAPAPLLVQAAAPDLTLAPSPAQVLGETLKAKPSRTRSVTATVDAKVKTAARASAAKTAAAKTAAAKAPAQAEPAAKPVKATRTASKAAGSKAAPATKAVARARAAEAVATVH